MKNVSCKGTDGNTFNEEIKSNVIYTNTGAPQGAVLSPFLFTVYTNNCQIPDSKETILIKFADDSTLQGLIKENESDYRKNVNWFVECVNSIFCS